MSDTKTLPENRFVYRLLYAKCSYGSMSHPINVAEVKGGHGVLFGPEAQPVLNANDWKPNINIIHFGDCTPRQQDKETGLAVEKQGFEKIFQSINEFFVAQKCKPMIETVWYETDDKYLIDGAPALLMKSMLFCKCGGIITIESTPLESAESEQQAEDIEKTCAEVNACVDQAQAQGKVDSKTAEFMKDGYTEALKFANGDVETANQLFSDLLNHSGDSQDGEAQEYASTEAQYDKFKLYLEHNDSPLANMDCDRMTVKNSFGEEKPLRTAVANIVEESGENEETENSVVPVVTTILG